jgi:hypothetical protein
MLDPTIFRLAKIMADERTQTRQPREEYAFLRYRPFKFQQHLLLRLAALLISAGTRLQAQFTDRPPATVSQTSL